MPHKKAATCINDLLASVTADLLEGGPQTFQDNSLRVERYILNMLGMNGLGRLEVASLRAVFNSDIIKRVNPFESQLSR